MKYQSNEILIRLPLSFSNINLLTFRCDFEQNLLNPWQGMKNIFKKEERNQRVLYTAQSKEDMSVT